MRRLRRERGDERDALEKNQAEESAVKRLLGRRLAEVEAELAAAAGGASLCSISKAAGSVPAAKYLEGRLAVLLQMLRGPSTTQEALIAVDELRAEWASELERVTRDSFGPDWRAYRAGGVDELNEQAEQLRAE